MPELRPLSEATTLRVGGVPGAWHIAKDAQAALDRLLVIRHAALTPFVLGGGSNCVVSDDPATVGVLQLAAGEPEILSTDEGVVDVRVPAGMPWDAFVDWAVERKFQGIECLAGIPGQVGATPIQNVGAYGQEVASVIKAVMAIDTQSAALVELSAPDCDFAYRHSRFNSVDTGRFVITDVRFALKERGEPCLAYPEVRRAALDAGACELWHVADLVRAIRRRKGMVVSPDDADSRSAGSFFRNPIVDAVDADRIVCDFPGDMVPRWDVGASVSGSSVKLSAAWLMERSGLYRGMELASCVRLSHKHVLALVTEDGAVAADVAEAAIKVQDAVQNRFGIGLVPEPVWVGFAERDVLPAGAVRLEAV
jgi:UDP-N-acetylmuramate dehydrogenase